jgi:hypothetical protein
VDAISLMNDFDVERGEHVAMPPEAFNDDHVYKKKLNQVLVISIKRNIRNMSIDKL